MADITERRVPDLSGFHAYFQPIVALRTGRLQGFELLARWKHPQRGWVSPDAFIPDAERDGWIDALTWELMRQAFAASARLPQPLSLAVNISPLQLRDADLPKQIQAIADDSRFPLECLTIEITESALTHDLAQARSIVQDLKRRGCALALDDFGTGYSSLSQLESLPFDKVKVDRTFTSAMARKAQLAEDRRRRRRPGAEPRADDRRGRRGNEGAGRDVVVARLRSAQGWLYGEAIAASDLDAAVFAALQARRSRRRSNDGPDETSTSGSGRASHAGEPAGAAARAAAGGLRWRAGRTGVYRRAICATSASIGGWPT